MTMVTVDELNRMLAREWPECGFTCTDVGPASAAVTVLPTAAARRPGGFVSGPTIFGAADAALWMLTSGALGRIEPHALTSELSIRFLQPAIGTALHARAMLNRGGRRSVVGTVNLWMDEQTSSLIATAQGTYMLPSFQPPAGQSESSPK